MSDFDSGGRPQHTQGNVWHNTPPEEARDREGPLTGHENEIIKEIEERTNGIGPLAHLSNNEIKQFVEDNFPDAVTEEHRLKQPPKHRRIVIGTLSYDGKMHCKHAFALLQAGFAIAKAGYELSFVLREGDSMVARGRNVLVAKFLEDPANTDLVLVDTDLDFSPEDFMKLVEAKTSDGKLCDVVAGCYPYKDDAGQFPLRWPIDGLFENNGLWEVQAVTPGFLKLSRNCLDRMTAQLPHLAYIDNALGDGRTSWMLFDNACRQNGVYDEGYVFCEHWHQVGGRVYIDPTVNISHIGVKAYNHGTVINWLERTAENVKSLKADFPHIPDMDLVPFCTKRRIDREKLDRKYSNEGKAGTTEVDLRTEPSKDGSGEFNHDGERGRGRSTDPGLAALVAQRLAPADLSEAAGGQSGGEVRQGAL